MVGEDRMGRNKVGGGQDCWNSAVSDPDCYVSGLPNPS